MDGYDRELGNIQRGKGQQVEAENGKREPVYTRATTRLMLCGAIKSSKSKQATQSWPEPSKKAKTYVGRLSLNEQIGV